MEQLTRCGKPALAFQRFVGSSSKPGVVFLPGFMSSMNGDKATSFDVWCRQNNHSYLRFDYQGTGSSSEGKLGLRHWVDDACDAFQELTEGPQVIIGSSMGAYIMMNLAMRFSERIAGLLALAPSFNFRDDFSKKLTADNVVDERLKLIPGDFLANCEELFSLDMIDEKKFSFPSDLHIVHGVKDDTIPWQKSVEFLEKCTNSAANSKYRIDLTLRDSSDHRLQTKNDLSFNNHMLQRILSNAEIENQKL